MYLTCLDFNLADKSTNERADQLAKLNSRHNRCGQVLANCITWGISWRALFAMVVSTESRMGQNWDDDHGEVASHNTTPYCFRNFRLNLKYLWSRRIFFGLDLHISLWFFRFIFNKSFLTPLMILLKLSSIFHFWYDRFRYLYLE